MTNQHKRRSNKRTKPFEFKFEIIAEINTIPYDLAMQSLTLDHKDRDLVYFTGNLEQKNLFDELCDDYAAEIRKERATIRRNRKLHK